MSVEADSAGLSLSPFLCSCLKVIYLSSFKVGNTVSGNLVLYFVLKKITDVCDVLKILQGALFQWRTQGVGGCQAAALPPPPNHPKLNIKDRFCRYYGIKSST
jgi:hypothetical protein